MKETEAMERMLSARPAWMEVDLDALRANYREIRRRVGRDVRVIAAIKADAYGHGALEVARVLGDLGVEALGTGSFSEAVELRQAGIETRILMFGGALPAAAAELLRHHLIPTVYNMEAAQSVSEAAKASTPVYVKIDCGFGRLGVAIETAKDFVAQVAALPHIVVEGIYTHMPFSDAAGREWARGRLEAFDQLVADLAGAGLEVPVTQAMGSGCLLANLTDRCNAICPGHLLYGLSPVTSELADMSAFRPVLREIGSRLIHVAHHPVGRAGLGGPYAIKGGSVTGVVPLGLHDGYRRPVAGKKAAMLVRGHRVPILGVSLEHTTLDLTDIDLPEVGEKVVALGGDGDDRIALEEIADWQLAGPLDVLMSFQGRLFRRYCGAESASPLV